MQNLLAGRKKNINLIARTVRKWLTEMGLVRKLIGHRRASVALEVAVELRPERRIVGSP